MRRTGGLLYAPKRPPTDPDACSYRSYASSLGGADDRIHGLSPPERTAPLATKRNFATAAVLVSMDA